MQLDRARSTNSACGRRIHDLEIRREHVKEDHEKRTLAVARLKTASALKKLLLKVDRTISHREDKGTRQVLSQVSSNIAYAGKVQAAIASKEGAASTHRAVLSTSERMSKIEQVKAIKSEADKELGSLLDRIDTLEKARKQS